MNELTRNLENKYFCKTFIRFILKYTSATSMVTVADVLRSIP